GRMSQPTYDLPGNSGRRSAYSTWPSTWYEPNSQTGLGQSNVSVMIWQKALLWSRIGVLLLEPQEAAETAPTVQRSGLDLASEGRILGQPAGSVNPDRPASQRPHLVGLDGTAHLTARRDRFAWTVWPEARARRRRSSRPPRD